MMTLHDSGTVSHPGRETVPRSSIASSPATLRALLQLIDHTLIRPEMTRAQVEDGIRAGVDLGVFAVVVRPWEVSWAAGVVAGSGVRLVASIGFPHGANTTDVKVYEAERAVSDGADEVDVVINVGAFLSGDYDYVGKELAAVIDSVRPVPVKALIESAFLEPSQVVDASKLAVNAGAAFVKNGTGFSPRGADPLEIALLRAVVGESVGVKAAGGIRDLDAALALVRAGANRLGTSATTSIAEQWRANNLQ